MTKILVIEDEKPIRESIIDTLEYKRYDVYGAGNGLTGVNAAIDIKPDLILCDVMMPELDGYGVLLELSQHPETARIPFMFLTARVTHEDVRKGMSMGADDYLTKPFSAEDLLEAVESRLERHARLEKYNLQQMEYMRQYINLTLPHELRTPLTGALGYLEMARYGVESNDLGMIDEMLGKSRKSLNRLATLIESFVAYSQVRLISNDPDIMERLKERSNLKDVDGVIGNIAEERAFHHRRLDDMTMSLEPAHVCIFYDHAKKLFDVIIDNAFKFSKKGTAVSVEGILDDRDYVVRILDKGRGMSEDEIISIGLNRQFEREKYEQQGAGLGLVIAQQIVAIYNGKMEVESSPGEGTQVTIKLPLLD